jgi:polysaccharide biosynthesis transport protein
MEPWRQAKRVVEGILRRRKRLALVTFVVAVLVLVPLAYFSSQEPPRFQTGATILLEVRPDRMPVFPEFSPFRPLPVQLAILNSRSLAESVVEGLSKASLQDLIMNPYYVDYSMEIKNLFRRLQGLEPEVESPFQRAVKELQNARVRFSARRGNGIVEMTSEAAKPQAAVDIVNAYIEALLARTRSFNIEDSRVTREFLEQQVADVKKGLQRSEETLRAFTVEHGGVRVPEQSQATTTRLAHAGAALAEVTANRKMTEVRLQSLRAKVESQKGGPMPAAPAPPQSVPPEVQRIRHQLSQLEAALLELRLKYTDEHPRIVLVKNQIAELKTQLTAAVKDTMPAKASPDVVPPGERADFSEQVVALETALHAMVAQEEALQKQVETMRQSLSGLSRSELEYARLVREADSQRSLFAMLSDRLTAARIREQGEMKVVKVIDPAGPAMAVTSAKRLRLSGLAFALAVVVGGGVPAAVEWMRRPVEVEADVQAATGLTVLSAIPRLRGQEPIFLSVDEMQALGSNKLLRECHLFSESFRTLRTGILLAARRSGIRTVLVTSAFAGEGKSMCVVNLGLAFSEAGRRVVLTDTDIMRPSLHEILDVPLSDGVIEALHARRDIEEALVQVGDRLWLAPRGGAPEAGSRGMLATSRLQEFADRLQSHGDLVLYDSSPVLLFRDTLFLATAVDAVILVVRAGGDTSRSDLARAKAALEGVGARLLGVVLNEVPSNAFKRSYYRYYATHDVAET